MDNDQAGFFLKKVALIENYGYALEKRDGRYVCYHPLFPNTILADADKFVTLVEKASCEVAARIAYGLLHETMTVEEASKYFTSYVPK